MKAKHFKRLRQELKLWDVWVTRWAYGVYPEGKHSITVFARYPHEAAERAHRKGLYQLKKFDGQESDSVLGSFAVRQHEKKSIKFVTYWM